MLDSSKSNNTEGDIWQGEVHPEHLPAPKVGGQPRHFTPEEVIEALQVGRGLKTMAARHLRCDWRTIQKMCADFPEVEAECEAQRQAFLDTAHLQLVAAVNRGEWKAIEFTLRTLGRDRGFSERTEVTGKDGGPIEHAHIHLWEERLQTVHDAMAKRKTALQLERTKDGGYASPVDPA